MRKGRGRRRNNKIVFLINYLRINYSSKEYLSVSFSKHNSTHVPAVHFFNLTPRAQNEYINKYEEYENNNFRVSKVFATYPGRYLSIYSTYLG